MSGQTLRGERLLLAAIGAGVLGLLATTALTLAYGGDPSPWTAVLRPLGFAAVGALAYTGRDWARWLAAWLVLLAATAAVGAVAVASAGRAAALAIFLALALLYLAAAVPLVASDVVRVFVARRDRDGTTVRDT